MRIVISEHIMLLGHAVGR